ncbi:MAG: lipoyl(octanoyl) transferase LipB [Mariprofundaceae bacterium]|nr:lipoyl(octanoyl) transferase LipB [Mariprofundaceae bacterium]
MHILRHEIQDYPDSLAEQESIVADILAKRTQDTMILTQHPPTYTIGSSGKMQDILSRRMDGESIAVHETGRGGEVTYHGPGQLICYVLKNIEHEKDLHQHIHRLEDMIIRSLADFSVSASRDSRGIGVWVNGLKIAALGVRCRKWVTFHGIALNIHPNLHHFKGIVPCGMRDAPVTSMFNEGVDVTREAVEERIIHHAQALFISGI